MIKNCIRRMVSELIQVVYEICKRFVWMVYRLGRTWVKHNGAHSKGPCSSGYSQEFMRQVFNFHITDNISYQLSCLLQSVMLVQSYHQTDHTTFISHHHGTSHWICQPSYGYMDVYKGVFRQCINSFVYTPTPLSVSDYGYFCIYFMFTVLSKLILTITWALEDSVVSDNLLCSFASQLEVGNLSILNCHVVLTWKRTRIGLD